MNARRLARGTRSFIALSGSMDCSPRAECRRLPLATPPGTWLLQWHLTAQYVSRLHPQSSPPPSIFWPRLRCSPLRLNNASAFGSIDCSLHSLRSSVTSLASCGFTTASTPCGHKLSSHFHFHFTPDTSGCAYGVGFVPITVCPETSACFSEPSMPCCRAPSSITHLRHTDSRAPPTHRGRSRLHSTPTAHSSPYIVRDAGTSPLQG